MTLASTRGTELSIQRVVLRAYQLAGLLNVAQGTGDPSWAQKLSFGEDLLQSLLHSLQDKGIFARQTVFYYLPLTGPTSPSSGTYIYAMPNTVFDVVGPGSYIAAAETDVTQATGETPVLERSRLEWQRMATKAAQSRPLFFFCDRAVFPVQVYLWPTPSEAGTIRFQCIQLPADSEDGSKTLDLERYWMDYVLWELAKRLAFASSLGADTVQMLSQEAMMALQNAKGYSTEHVGQQAHVEHGGHWNRRTR